MSDSQRQQQTSVSERRPPRNDSLVPDAGTVISLWVGGDHRRLDYPLRAGSGGVVLDRDWAYLLDSGQIGVYTTVVYTMVAIPILVLVWLLTHTRLGGVLNDGE